MNAKEKIVEILKAAQKENLHEMEGAETWELKDMYQYGWSLTTELLVEAELQYDDEAS